MFRVLMFLFPVKVITFLFNRVLDHTAEVELLSSATATHKLYQFRKQTLNFEKLSIKYSTSRNKKLKILFNLLLKASYKYEAKLHRIAFSEAPVIPTPEYIKEALSDLSRRALLKSINSK